MSTIFSEDNSDKIYTLFLVIEYKVIFPIIVPNITFVS